MAPQPANRTSPANEHPDGRLRTLEQFAKRARDQAELAKLDAAAVQALDAFEVGGVGAILLKGPALARLLYGASEYRGYSDVDLLIAPSDLEAARQILGHLGYVNVRERLGIDEVTSRLPSEDWVVDSSGLMVDLHWRLPGAEAEPDVVWRALSSRRTSIDLDGRTVPVLDRVGLAVHLATHAAKHGVRYSQPVDDLLMGLARWPVDLWRAAERLARELDATAAFAAGLRLVPEGAALAHRLGLRPAHDLEWTIAHDRARPRGTFHLEAFTKAETLRERASLLRRSLFPRPVWIIWQYRWSQKSRLHLVAAYAVHVARTPIWAARAVRFRLQARRR